MQLLMKFLLCRLLIFSQAVERLLISIPLISDATCPSPGIIKSFHERFFFAETFFFFFFFIERENPLCRGDPGVINFILRRFFFLSPKMCVSFLGEVHSRNFT